MKLTKILKKKFEDKFVLSKMVYSDKSDYQNCGNMVFTFEFKPQTRTFSVLDFDEYYEYQNRYQKIKLKYHQLHFVYDYELKKKYVDNRSLSHGLPCVLKNSVKKIKLNMMDEINLQDMYFTETSTTFENARAINMLTLSNISEGHICMGDDVSLYDYKQKPRNTHDVYKQIMKNSEELCNLFFTTSFEHKINKKKSTLNKKEFYERLGCGSKQSIIQINKGKF
jgi:hypothetical protein